MVNSTSINTETPQSGFLRLHQILKLIPIGRSTWWKWVAVGKAPKPYLLGPRTTAWKTSDISQFISELEEGGRKNESA